MRKRDEKPNESTETLEISVFNLPFGLLQRKPAKMSVINVNNICQRYYFEKPDNINVIPLQYQRYWAGPRN